MVSSRLVSLVLVCALELQGCGALHSLSPKGQNITGLWMGKTTSSIDANSVDISLAVFQDGDDEFSGLYDRGSGVSVCRAQGCAGTLAGRISAPVFRVNLDDNSWCTFSGGFLAETADGHYSCYYRSGRIERGFWNVKLQHWRPGNAL